MYFRGLLSQQGFCAAFLRVTEPIKTDVSMHGYARTHNKRAVPYFRGFFPILGFFAGSLSLPSGFWPRVRARALTAHVCHPKRGAARHPPPIAASFQPPKINKIYPIGPPTSRAFFFLLDHRGYEIWGPLPPAPPIADSLILPAIFWGQNYVPVRPYALIFSVFPFFYSFGSFLFVILFFSFSPFQFFLILLFLSYPSLLIYSYSSRRCYSSSSYSSPLIFKLFVVLQITHIRHSEWF